MAPIEPRRRVGKKYVIACDGTWQNSDMGYDLNAFAPPTAQVPSNVTRIVRAINHNDSNGVPQVVFYQRGAGSDDDFRDKFVNGLTGGDISEHVREAYGFLANNFNPETQAQLDDPTQALDEIIILGFSRGAFTARAISSLISDIGLLTRVGMESFWGIFGDWMKQDTEGSKWFQSTYGEKIAFTDPRYRQRLISDGLTRWGMPIRAVGVWDTVGALGIPLPWSDKNVKEYSFVNTKVAQAVQHAFHAIALDEDRNLFSPTLWETPDVPNKLRVLNQVWFPGVHSNVGGSYHDAGMSNITLAWMVSQLEDNDGGILDFNSAYLDWVQDMNTQGYKVAGEAVRPWGLGKIYDSTPNDTFFGKLQGFNPVVRTPGRYHRISTVSGKQVSEPLKGTFESVHRSVRVRMADGGLGVEEKPGKTMMAKVVDGVKKFAGLPGKYDSPALKGFELILPVGVKEEKDHGAVGKSGVYYKGKDGKGDLIEAELGRTEIRLLKRSVDTAKGKF